MTDWQPIIFTGKAIIKTPTQTIEIKPSEVEWETESDGDNPMGADVQHTGVYCFDGGEIVWTAYEYPEGTLDGDIRIEANGAEIVQNFDDYQLASDTVDDAPDFYEEGIITGYTQQATTGIDIENDPCLKNF